jgi:hypothetical protein
MLRSRRQFLLLALPALAGVLAPLAASAQDPRESLVQAAAREWLQKTDALDGQGSFEAAGAKFKAAITAAQWTEALKKARGPFGKALQRASISTKFTREFKGVPDGDYALLVFRTAFEKKSEAHESVTLEREADGQWRVIGYFIR